MRSFLTDLLQALNSFCPTFLHLPQDTPYPHITLEEISSLTGLPAGPLLLTFTLKIRSRYAGTKEILTLLHQVESILKNYPKGSCKVMKSFLSLVPEGDTRIHTLHVKAKVSYGRD